MTTQAKNLFRRLTPGNGGSKIKKFGAFGGVFTPDVLTILGVIMYLRLGWVVGNAGFIGAVVIILLAKSVSLCTGLSMSSITTNIKIGAGGAYSIISKSLGLEAGGSIGIPLYIGQTLSAALYLIGFTEAWIRVFPHNFLLEIVVLPEAWVWMVPRVYFVFVSLVAWAILLTISYISAQLAIRVQYIIMTLMAISILSFMFTPVRPAADFVLIGKFEDASFWQVFAIFFPAVTGIMAGANMSGDLKNPRRAIPLGTISAILVTTAIYVGLAYILAQVATPEELRANQLIMVDKAFWASAVLAGVMGATLSSALGSMLGAPRLLQALAEQRTMPFYKTLEAKTATNEPRNAIIVTGVFIAAALILGNLDYLATLITMFFLITYGTLNLVVFLQQSMKIISFRPTFKIPRFVSFYGAVSSIFMMFLINPVFGFVSFLIIIVLYFWLARRGLSADWGDIRGGLFIILAERAARLADKFPRDQISWKPDLLVPVEEPPVWAGPLLFIRSITYPSGSIFAFTVKDNDPNDENQLALDELLSPLKEQNILVNSTVIEDRSFLHGATSVIQTLRGGSFRPNTLFLTMSTESKNTIDDIPEIDLGQKLRLQQTLTQKDEIMKELVAVAAKYHMGVILLRQHPQMAFGIQQDVNLWLRDKSPNWHLAILIALQLQLNWEGRINLITATANGASEKRLHKFLERLSDQARLPSRTEFHVLHGSFKEALQTAPRADVNIFGLSLTDGELPLDFVREVSESIKSSCVFVIDSGQESALV